MALPAAAPAAGIPGLRAPWLLACLALLHPAGASEMPSWDAAHAWAQGKLAAMSRAEKHSLLAGVGWQPAGGWFSLKRWWYVGNTLPLRRHGIPGLTMHDAGAGFRTYWHEQVGTVTCWPSMLSLAASWDTKLAREYAAAVGKEFAGKGANGLLGPSVEVHRVARNGRNFEYLSGEDPYLGRKLTEAFVRGVQSQGVFATVKHFAFNQQEEGRDWQSSVVDDKTAWELYYPPFEGAVKADVSAVMCSYNRIDGEYACGNKRQLKDVLKGKMGFRGFVMSDWWATHGTKVAEGLDQEMPGVGRTTHYTHEHLSRVEQHHIDEAAGRVLGVIYRMGLGNKPGCVQPPCQDWHMRVVTSSAHVNLARRVAAESVVLLQNRGGVLPLEGGSAGVGSVAIIGEAAVAQPYDPSRGHWAKGDYYSGGGSGHVTAGNVVRPLEALRRRAAQAGLRVVESLSNDARAGAEAAGSVDVAIVVAATTSGETKDRPNLNLDNNADHLIAGVARRAKRTVVLMQAPGAVVMPWRDDVAGIMVMFLGGQETGNAWAEVVFGDSAPAGRLPVMMPASEADTIPPDLGSVARYTEGLATSYRNKAFVAAFPFGHGLGYTTFEYGPLSARPCSEEGAVLCVYTSVKNAGGRQGSTVGQLYLELSAEAQHPAAFLKGFSKTDTLHPGEAQEVSFRLTARDLSYYSSGTSDWRRAAGATAHVGESSADIRQSLALHGASSVLPPV